MHSKHDLNQLTKNGNLYTVYTWNLQNSCYFSTKVNVSF